MPTANTLIETSSTYQTKKFHRSQYLFSTYFAKFTLISKTHRNGKEKVSQKKNKKFLLKSKNTRKLLYFCQINT